MLFENEFSLSLSLAETILTGFLSLTRKSGRIIPKHTVKKVSFYMIYISEEEMEAQSS